MPFVLLFFSLWTAFLFIQQFVRQKKLNRIKEQLRPGCIYVDARYNKYLVCRVENGTVYMITKRGQILTCHSKISNLVNGSIISAETVTTEAVAANTVATK